MKKFFLSVSVIVVFVAYSMYHRFFSESSVSVISPNTINSLSTTSQTIPTDTPAPKQNSQYKDGTYTGDAVDVFYGNIQLQATISGGRIVSIQFLQFPNDRDTSRMINAQADPMLAQEAIQAQSAQVDIISGATDSSQGFIQSLQSILDKARN